MYKTKMVLSAAATLMISSTAHAGYRVSYRGYVSEVPAALENAFEGDLTSGIGISGILHYRCNSDSITEMPTYEYYENPIVRVTASIDTGFENYQSESLPPQLANEDAFMEIGDNFLSTLISPVPMPIDYFYLESPVTGDAFFLVDNDQLGVARPVEFSVNLVDVDASKFDDTSIPDLDNIFGFDLPEWTLTLQNPQTGQLYEVRGFITFLEPETAASCQQPFFREPYRPDPPGRNRLTVRE